MSKRKAPKFNTVLEDFRKFIGESKEAEESQGKSESSVALGKSDSEVVQELPGGGKTKGGPSEPVSNKGVDATKKLPGTTEPSKEEPVRKECAPSSKVAEEAPSELVNRLLSNIKLAVEAIEGEEKKEAAPVESKKELKGEQTKLDLDGDGKIEADDLKKLRESKDSKSASEESQTEEAASTEEVKEESKEEVKEAESCDSAASMVETQEEAKEESEEEKEESKEEKEEEEEKEESKEASEDCQKQECGKCGSEKKETLEIDEDKLAEKIAAHYRNISVGYELGKFLFGSLGQKQAEAPMAEAPAEAAGAQSEIELILQALQELVASGEISEEQAQNVLMQLQAAAEGGAAPEASATAEEPKMANEIFSEDQVKEIEASINAKVAEWVAEGKTDAEITDLIKQAAESDASLLIGSVQQDKVASEAEQVENQIIEAVNAKVAELKEAGATEEQISQYLEEAAKADAQILIKAAQQEKIAAELLGKIEQKRQEKLANVSPEVQQILEALEALLQSGQITEEEAMMVLQELGLAGGEQAAASAEEAPAAPAEEAPVAPQAADKKEDK